MSTPRHTNLPEELQEALQQKPAAEQDRIRQVWQLLGHLDHDDVYGTALDIPATEEALADLEAAIDSGAADLVSSDAGDQNQKNVSDSDKEQPQLVRFSDRTPNRLAQSVRTGAMRWTTAGASLFLALFAVMIWYWRVPVVVKAPLGEQVTAVLPDNSVVTLNSGSRLEYARRFESWPLIATAKRRVTLQGEAFFEVEKMDRTFVVESFNAQVRVLGTAFNVWAREHDNMPETRVSLTRGSVLVTHHTEDALNITLDEAGEMARVISHLDGTTESLFDTVPVDRMAAWRSYSFSVQALSVSSIVSEMERRYSISIQIDEEIDASHTLTLFMQQPAPEKILESICLSLGCQYRRTSDGFSIVPMDVD